MIKPPWTQEQVAALNAWQQCGWVHEFTCGRNHTESRVLVATPDGWWCRACDYTQDWAHDFMFDGPPPNPFEAFALAGSSAPTPDAGQAESMDQDLTAPNPLEEGRE